MPGIFFSHTFEIQGAPRVRLLFAYPILCFKSNIDRIQRADHLKYQRGSLAMNRLATQACFHTNDRRDCYVHVSEFDARLLNSLRKLFPPQNNSKSTLFSLRLSACPTQCFKSQVGTLQWSEQHKSQRDSFARKRLSTQACIHMNTRRGCCVLVYLCPSIFSTFYSALFPRIS